MRGPPSSSRSSARAPSFGIALASALAVVALAWSLVHRPAGAPRAAPETTARPPKAGPHRSRASPNKLKHLVFVMQENRSFDSYFGTFPGADGYPARNGHLAGCLDNPILERCQRPYHDPSLVNVGGPHDSWNARAAIDGGRMDGFIRTILVDRAKGCRRSGLPPDCQNGRSPDV